MSKKMVIFDFDGVIVDSWWLAHKTALKEFPTLTEELHKTWFEGNIHNSWMNDEQLEHNSIDYFGEYQKELHLVKFFIGMEAVVKELANEHLLSIVSSSTTPQIEEYLTREGIRQCFKDILGADVHHSKHEKIKMLFDSHPITAKDCVMVTDTVGDVREARMSGVDSIGVSWGFHEVERLQKVATFRIVHVPKELTIAIKDYFSR